MRDRFAAVTAAVVVATVACGGDAKEPEPVVITDVPTSYRIDYRIEDPDRDSSERVTVRRPFDSRIETFDGSDDLSGEPTVIEINTFGRSSRQAGADQRIAVAVPLGPPAVDVRLDVVLDDALASGLLERRGTKEIAGRPCQVYRTGQALRLVDLVPPSADQHVEVCIDAAGLVLEEVERVDGEDGRRRVAIEVETDPALDDDLFDAGERTVPIERGGGAVRQVTRTSRTPGTFFELGDELPLPHTGRYAVVPPQPDAFADPLQRGRRVASLTDVLRRGRELVTVDRGGSLEGTVEVPGREHAEPIELGERDGDVDLTAQGRVITIELDGNRFLRVAGTLPATVLADIARGLRQVDGGAITPIGEAW